ncbi:MAG: HAD hydrolase-like protein [Chloroflexota bacterium]|nr:HAD hydrolase-like protein [Chloroflexota bacterium]
MKLVIFDLDQTLVEFITVHDEAARKLFRQFFGVDARLTEIDYAGRSLTDSFAELARRKNIPNDRVKPEELLESYEKLFAESIPRDAAGYILPGVEELLEALSRTGHLLALYTGDSKAVATSILSATSLDRHFRFAVFGTDAPTRAGMVQLALDKAE